MQNLIRPSYLKDRGWYPQTKEEALKFLTPSKTSDSITESSFSFAIVPHAGWTYSGKTAGKVYSSLPTPDIAIFLATNHTGLGTASSLWPYGKWKMPMGELEVEGEVAQLLLNYSTSLKADTEAHLYEHAIEVQLPFLQLLCANVKIVPIEMRDYRIETCKEIAQALAKTMEAILSKEPQKKLWLIASSDMSHCGQIYGQLPPKKMSADEFARKQDSLAIEKMLILDAEGLLKTVEKNNITMCGSGPVASVLEAAKILGFKKGELLSYTTSADVSGKDSEIAVGYAGILIR